MATIKKKVNTKTTKKVQVKDVLTDEEKILGKEPEIRTKTVFNYESESVRYKVTNLEEKNGYIIVTGNLIETFIGTGNIPQRELLKSGAKEVITKDSNGKELYKIQVIDE